MRKNEIDAIRNSVLFSSLDDDEFASLSVFLDGTPEEFPAGSVIYSPDGFRKSLGILLKGSATVTNGGMLMSIISKGKVFGIPVLFSDQPFPTLVTAKENCRIYFIDRDSFLFLMQKSPLLTSSFLAILSNRIMFLTGRLDSVSAATPTEKLKAFLVNTAAKTGSSTFNLPVSVSGLASALSLGRTTLYRAFDELENSGFITRDGKLITINK